MRVKEHKDLLIYRPWFPEIDVGFDSGSPPGKGRAPDTTGF
jgi:hypothetical protein